MATQNEFGVWEPSRYDELASEFNGEVPDWESRLADFDAHESGEFVFERDLEIGDFVSTPIADWSVFLAIETFEE